MDDRNLGRSVAPFAVKGNPDHYTKLIQNHGIYARIMRARKCPCAADTGSASMYCTRCGGDGYIYDFQRRFLQVDEDSPRTRDGTTVFPFRIPIIEPVSVSRMAPSFRGGIVKYDIPSFTNEMVTISGTPLPKHYDKLKVAYYFDKFSYVLNETPDVDGVNRILSVSSTLADPQYGPSTYYPVHGDITLITQLIDTTDNYEFKKFTFKKNKIYIDPSEKEPTPGKISVSFYYAPASLVVPSDIDVRREKGEKFTSEIPSGNCRIALEGWYEIGEGDFITLLGVVLWKNEIFRSTGSVIDRLFEFDVQTIDELIFDDKGKQYFKGKDFLLKNYREITWISDNKPIAGSALSARYGYNPTYVVFIDESQQHTYENKQYPQTVSAKLWAKTLVKDVVTIASFPMEGSE